MSVEIRKRRKLPSAPARVLSWVGEEGVIIPDSTIKPDLDRFAKFPSAVLAQLKAIEGDKSIIPGQKFTEIPTSDDDMWQHRATTRKGKNITIELKMETFRRIAGIREFADANNSYLIRKIEIRKVPGKSLGFYIRQGDGWDRRDGIFISRLILGSYIEANDFLRVGDEILKVNEVDVSDFSLNDVVLMMQMIDKLVLTVKVLTSLSLVRSRSMRLSTRARALSPEYFAASPVSESVTVSPTAKYSTSSSEHLSFTEHSSFMEHPSSIPHLSSTGHPAPPVEHPSSMEHCSTDVMPEQITTELPSQTVQTKETITIEDSVSNTSELLSITQVLEEGYRSLDSEGSVMVVDVHNTKDDEIEKSEDILQMTGLDASPKAVIVNLDTSNPELDRDQEDSNTAEDKSEMHDASGGIEQFTSTSDQSMDESGKEAAIDEVDFSLFKKSKKKVSSNTDDTYSVEKSLWQKQEESMSHIDPIRDMEDTTTTFIGKAADESSPPKITDSSSSVTVTQDDPTENVSCGTTVMIKIKTLLDISSFAPSSLFCSVLIDHRKKASTKAKSTSSTIDFDEIFYLDLHLVPTELEIALCEPGMDERIIGSGFAKPPPGCQTSPTQFNLEIASIGVLTLDIQLLSLEDTFPRYNRTIQLTGKAYNAPFEALDNSEIPEILQKCVEAIEKHGLKEDGLYFKRVSEERILEAKTLIESTDNLEQTLTNTEVHVISCVIQDLLKALPNPVFSNIKPEMIAHLLSGDQSRDSIWTLLWCMKESDTQVIIFMLNHLRNVLQYCNTNKLDLNMLSQTFGPLLLFPTKDSSIKLDFTKVIELLLHKQS
ncbi:rho GTPase-activating protein syd-1-like [Dysidea avara]|uniref:rho GTPase-activating protein syd-1-like n=1 Tax=Dysidea avara TaxID=196820 RepID=UPI00331FCB6A